MVDDLFSLGPAHPSWYGNAWKNYLDDFAIRSGRFANGLMKTDEEYEEELRAACPAPAKPYTLGDALDAAGF